MSRIDVRRSTTRAHASKVSGKLEVLDPEGDDPLKRSGSQKRCTCDSRELASKQQPIHLQNGKLEVLGPSEDVIIYSAESASRPGSSGRQGSAGKKCYASTKQISLRTVKPIKPSSKFPDYNIADLEKSKKTDIDPVHKETIWLNTAAKDSTEVHSAPIHNPNITEQPQESSSDDDENDDEKPTAPIELLAEFIKAVMDADYKLAWKLCQMILLYEPENPEAKQFSSLIQKMLQNEEDHDSDEEEDGEDSDEDGDSSCTDDSDSNSTETSETSSEDEANY